MSLLQFMLTGSPGYSKEVPRKKVMSVFPSLPPELSISWEEQVPPFSRHVSTGYVLEKMDFLHVFSEHLHQRKLIPSSGGGGVTSLNTATKALIHDKFSTDRGSHRCCETFRQIQGTYQPSLSSVMTRSTPYKLCVHQLVPSWHAKLFI